MTRTRTVVAISLAVFVLVCGAVVAAILTSHGAGRESHGIDEPPEIETGVFFAAERATNAASVKCSEWLDSKPVTDSGDECGVAYETIYRASENPSDGTTCPPPCIKLWKKILEEPACVDEDGRIRGITPTDECIDPVFSTGDESPSSPDVTTGVSTEPAPAPSAP